MAFELIPELVDNPYRLGRHYDRRAQTLLKSDGLRLAETLESDDQIQTVDYQETEDVWDQGDLGSCTANAALGCLISHPFSDGTKYTEDDAVALYITETLLDSAVFGGKHYPPDDTGSTGPWSMMALQQLGKIDGFIHASGSNTALKLLNKGPISIGVPWFKSMFAPDADHEIHVDVNSQLAGGHQVCVTANDAKRKRIKIRNSWGLKWGDRGHAWLSWDGFHQLMIRGGDAVQPVILESPND